VKIRNAGRDGHSKTELTMTSMIDVVFLLLIFFIMTFQIVSPEGDFDVRMPRVAAGPVEDVRQLPPIKVRLLADADGRLAGIRMGQRDLEDFDQLHAEIRRLIGDDVGPVARGSAEVELDCDYQLKYEHAMAALTAVSGYVDEGRIVGLIEKVRFAR